MQRDAAGQRWLADAGGRQAAHLHLQVAVARAGHRAARGGDRPGQSVWLRCPDQHRLAGAPRDELGHAAVTTVEP
jgi:hypothetical protein